MGLTDDHFDAIVDELTDALDSFGVAQDDIKAIIGTVEGLRNDTLDR